jgi:SpoVK/Ycf46/Vps4 family AAA+-type ATPase
MSAGKSDFVKQMRLAIEDGDKKRQSTNFTDKISALSSYLVARYFAELSGDNNQKDQITLSVQSLADDINAANMKKDDDSEKVNYIDPDTLAEFNLNDLSGLEREKLAIRDSFIYPAILPGLYKKPKGGILLYGPPGTGKNVFISYLICLGKTQIAKGASSAISLQGIRVTMFNADSASMKSKWSGGTEKQIKKYFTEAQKVADEYLRNCQDQNNDFCKTISILFMDEFEAIGGNRDTDDPTMTHSVNALISNMQGIESYNDVVVLAATNKPWKLDAAVMRRFSARLFVDIPNDAARRHLIRAALGKIYGNFALLQQRSGGQRVLDDLIGKVAVKTGVNSSVVSDKDANSSQEAIGIIVKEGKAPLNWILETGRQPSNDAQSGFGYSASDLDQIVSRASINAARRCKYFQVQNDGTWLSVDAPRDPANVFGGNDARAVRAGDIVEISQLLGSVSPDGRSVSAIANASEYLSKLTNFTITYEDFEEALRDYPSTIVETDYLQYLHYSRYNSIIREIDQ